MADVDHELLYDPALGGIDDEAPTTSTGSVGWTTRACSPSSTNNDTATGAPHPLAALWMTANEWDDEQRLQRAVGYTAVAVAHTAIAGAARMHSLDSMLPVTPQRQGESTNEAVVVSDLRYTVPSASARRWVASARQPYAR